MIENRIWFEGDPGPSSEEEVAGWNLSDEAEARGLSPRARATLVRLVAKEIRAFVEGLEWYAWDSFEAAPADFELAAHSHYSEEFWLHVSLEDVLSELVAGTEEPAALARMLRRFAEAAEEAAAGEGR